MRKSIARYFVLILVITLAFAAQEPYRLPSKDMIDIVTATQPSSISVGPNNEHMLLITCNPMPSTGYMSQPLSIFAERSGQDM